MTDVPGLSAPAPSPADLALMGALWPTFRAECCLPLLGVWQRYYQVPWGDLTPKLQALITAAYLAHTRYRRSPA